MPLYFLNCETAPKRAQIPEIFREVAFPLARSDRPGAVRGALSLP